MLFSERMKQAVKAAGGVGVLATRAGVSRRTINNYMAGATEPKAVVVERIADAAHISAEWLLTGKGMVSAVDLSPDALAKRVEQPSASYREPSEIDPDRVKVPLYDVRAAAGHGAISQEGEPSDFWSFSRVWLDRELRIPASRLILVTISGDSMSPDLHDGDVVMVDRGDTQVLREGIYVYFRSGRVYIKRLRLLDGQMSISSSNADQHPPEVVALSAENETFRVIGRVVGQPTFKRF